MAKLRTEMVAFGLVCALLACMAAVSATVYPEAATLFTYAAVAALLIALTGGSARTLVDMWPAWLVLLIDAASGLWSVSINLSAGRLFMLAPLVVFSCVAAYSCGGDRRDKALKLLVALAAAVSLYGIYQYAAGFGHSEEYLREYGQAEFGLTAKQIRHALEAFDYRRAFSTMFSPNALAGYLAMTLPVGLALYMKARKYGEKTLWAAAVALMFGCAALTKSTGGLAAMAAGLAVFAALTFRGGRGWNTAVVAAVAVLCAAGYFVLSSRTGGSYGIENSISERANYFRGAFATFMESPVIGRGAGTFQVTYLAKIPPGGGGSRYAHDLPLQTLAETGLAGLAAVAALFGAFFGRCRSVIRSGGPDAPVYAALAAGGAAFLAHNLVDFTYYVIDSAVVWWLYFGLVTATEDDSRPLAKPVSVALKLITAGLALVFVFFYAMADFAASAKAGAEDILREAGITSAQQARSGPVPGAAISAAGVATAAKLYDDGLHVFLGYLDEGAAYKVGPGAAKVAEEQYREAIRLNPLYPYHYRDLGLLYRKMGREAEAMAMFEEASRLFPSDKTLAGYLSAPE